MCVCRSLVVVGTVSYSTTSHSVFLSVYTHTHVCRIANGVLEKVGPQLVSGNLLLVEEWLSGASEILDIMGKESVLKLFRLADALPHIFIAYVQLLTKLLNCC